MTPNDIDETDETNRTDELTECQFCGEEFSEGSTDLPFHWYCNHIYELDDEQYRAARIEYSVRLFGSIDVDVPVAIPRDTWEDVVAFEFDDENPEDVAPGDVSTDTLVDLVDPEYHFRVAGREDPVRCAQCGHEAEFDEASGELTCPRCDGD
jgi:hypothetical protein